MYKELIKEYVPKNEQEEIDKKGMLQFIERNADCLLRDNLVAHFTSSAIVINKKHTKVLFAHHNIYDSWGWVGGHVDGDSDFLHVALKEAKEETGVLNILPLSNEIQSIETLMVPNHIKNGTYISDHLHMNVTYILEADENQQLFVKRDENSGVKWFTFSEALKMVTEAHMLPIYQKLFKRIKTL